MKATIYFNDENQGAIEACEIIDKTIQSLISMNYPIGNFQFKINIFKELNKIEIDSAAFNVIKDNEGMEKNNKSMSIVSTQLKSEITEEKSLSSVSYLAVETFMDNWLKYYITELKVTYQDRMVYLEIPRAFSNLELYASDKSGYSQESLLWKTNYIIMDELHKIGGLKDE